ncbi:uncharacterized protein GGS22DRAFT_151229 [Annulohypoxylon maeteangense]|uniref:uncharacterized protein n=1 Tax=Annulohypoxylon maeteangense TaxID=1927788 RepID=UPI0020087C13|nr:uncharacterized protein GGS22DRAFT_151229 [Annulohypoxylon maeteangense]KAI0890560.1 hypothetical protein GGS22DRAFT_151229 [Annulohypoxylon maeteangense]
MLLFFVSGVFLAWHLLTLSYQPSTLFCTCVNFNNSTRPTILFLSQGKGFPFCDLAIQLYVLSTKLPGAFTI